ncbi:MAG: ribokinase [Verrucomicrobiaceae bacterium]|nr:ribokinase [Verrucomicrobiaceae bacterium]
MPKAKPTIIIGSLHLDYVTRVEHLPLPGETLAAEHFDLFRGGKGANQALAVARQGGKALLFGAVGADREGVAYRTELEAAGIDLTHLQTAEAPTGCAFITVDGAGENTIVIASGANLTLSETHITRHRKVIEAAGVLLGQLEVPPEALVAAALIANKAGLPVVINPSPVHPAFPWEQFQTDYAIVNESEAHEMLGFPATPPEAPLVRDMMHQLRIAHLIVTRGAEDTLVFRREGAPLAIPTLPVLPVDTVGAGDAFAGCFAARLAEGATLTAALCAANCAGALATLGVGAQDSIPDREQVDAHLLYYHQVFPSAEISEK